MKICIVLGNYHSFGMGGSEIQAHYLAEYLGKMGVEVDYVFHGEKNSLTRFGTFRWIRSCASPWTLASTFTSS